MVNKRHKFWQNQLASMGKVINVVPINTYPNKSVVNCVESMVATTRSKILEVSKICFTFYLHQLSFQSLKTCLAVIISWQ